MAKTQTAHALPSDLSKVPCAADYAFAIIVSDWHKETVTGGLLNGCLEVLLKQGADPDQIDTFRVPGCFELPTMAGKLAASMRYDAIICLGCVIQGETRHFEFISQAVANGLTNVGIQYETPVIFGVLTTDNLKQAQERSGGALGNKGAEAAIAAIEMAETFSLLNDEEIE